MRWWRSRTRVERLPIEIEPVRLFASRVGWLVGLLWIVLAISVVAGLVVGVVHASTSETGARAVMLCGVGLATPGILLLSWVMLVAGAHLLRPRRGTISFDDERLVIVDRWLLSEPLVIARRDVAEIRPVARLNFVQYSLYAGKKGQDLAASGLLLDWGTRPNFRIVFKSQRQFLEAIRTLPSQTAMRTVSKYLSDDGLLIKVIDPDAASRKFSLWLRHAEDGRRRDRSTTARTRDPAHFSWLMLMAFVGFVGFCLGAAQ